MPNAISREELKALDQRCPTLLAVSAPPAELVLIQYPGWVRGATMSPPCGKIHMVLRYKGLRCRVINVHSPAEARRASPRGRVPVLVIGGRMIEDSAEILLALDELQPQPPLLPADPALRARARVLEDWADEVLYFLAVWFRYGHEENCRRVCRLLFARSSWIVKRLGPFFVRRMTRRRLHGQGTGDKQAAAIEREFVGALDAVQSLLGTQVFLLGDQLSSADLAIAALLDQVDLPEATPWPAERIRELPALMAWRGRVRALCGNAAAGDALPPPSP